MNSEERIPQLYQEILAQRFSNPQNVFLLCNELLSYAEKEQNLYAKAYAYVYMADTCILQNSIEDAFTYISEAMQLIKANHFDELLGTAYNLTAIIFCIKQDDLTALSYSLEGLDFAHQKNDRRLSDILYSNIGSIFLKYDASLAHRYFTMAENINSTNYLSNDQCNDETAKYNMEVHTTNLAISLLHMGKYQEALDLISPFLEENSDPGSLFQPIPFFYVQAVAYHHLGMYYKAKKTCENFLSYLQHATTVIEDYDYLFLTIKEFLALEFYDEVANFLSFLSHYNNLQDNICQAWNLESLNIDYYQRIHNEEELLSHYRSFYQYQLQKNAYLQAEYIISIENKLALEQELVLNQCYEKDTADLEQLSEKDSLTGLYNRYGLQKYYSTYFYSCGLAKKNFGLMILDIDHFKAYNDTKGHLAGDECIKQVASLLLDAIPKNFLCARFGGDEFFVVCHNVTKEAFVATVENIFNSIRGQEISFAENEPYGIVTVSLGAILTVPQEKQTISQFISSADEALYQVKNTRRNHYQIIYSIDALML